MPVNKTTRRLDVPGSTRFDEDEIAPLKVFGPEHSYFTGKLESVLRYMEVPYSRFSVGVDDVVEETGIPQVPAVQLADGRWLTDTTPIINWLDQRYPEMSIIPQDPVLGFFSRLFEDYADEWFWRPAMHYRWDYQEGSNHLGRSLAKEVCDHLPFPTWLMRRMVVARQRTLFTKGDGVSAFTWHQVEKIYLDILEQLSAIFETRPFLLGTRPSLADFAMFGPSYRHFSMDPTSQRIMLETAAAVYEWVARVWNARTSKTQGELVSEIPEDWGPMLNAMGSAYLPFMCANSEARNAGEPRFDFEIDGVRYRDIRTSRYRVWCLEELQRHFNELPDDCQKAVQERLESHGCWEPLWRCTRTYSGVDRERKAPFVGNGSQTGLTHAEGTRFHWGATIFDSYLT